MSPNHKNVVKEGHRSVRKLWLIYYRFIGLKCHNFALYLCFIYIYKHIYITYIYVIYVYIIHIHIIPMYMYT